MWPLFLAGWRLLCWESHPLRATPTALVTLPGKPGHLCAGLVVACRKTLPRVGKDRAEPGFPFIGRFMLAAGMFGDVFPAEYVDHNSEACFIRPSRAAVSRQGHELAPKFMPEPSPTSKTTGHYSVSSCHGLGKDEQSHGS